MGDTGILAEAGRLVTSKAARRAVLNASLLVGFLVGLFCAAGVASWVFYNNYLPDQIVTLPIHLQYGAGLNPYAIAPIRGAMIKDRQDYDVSVTLLMPRSPANVNRGNFMVSLFFLDSSGISQDQGAPYLPPEPYGHFDGKTVLFSSRRPALVPYQDPFVSSASKLLFLFYHMLFPSTQTCTLTIPMAEAVQFRRASLLPASLYIEVQAGQTIEVSRAEVTLTARLRGLRWLMYNYRLFTFAALCTLFWTCEFAFLCLAWLVWSGGSGAAAESRAKSEPPAGSRTREELPDVPATFPTYGRQPPLKYEPRVKDEQKERLLEDVPPPGAEADDEDDDGHESRSSWKGDSGIGTSYSEGGGTTQLRRRTSQHR